MTTLVKMRRDDKFADVHPGEVGNYSRAGFVVCEDSEINHMRGALDAAGVKYRKNASDDTIKELFAELEANQ